MFFTKYKTPLGQNRWSGRIKELQAEVRTVRTNRSVGLLYREGRGGTVYTGFGTTKPAPVQGGSDTWA